MAVILLAAKLGGEIAERLFRQPPVLGELAAGIIIGPYALGGLAIPGVGAFFPLPEAAGQVALVPISTELYAVAQIAVIVLLFVAGLETDLGLFLRYVGPASLVAAGGIILPFVLGAGATILFGFGQSFMEPGVLFVGAVMTATSVGITARVLSDIKRLHSPEGVTILGAAVLDDVLGILVMAIVVSMAVSGAVSGPQIAIIGGKAVGVWLGLTGVGILLSGVISRFIGGFRTDGAAIALALALAFFASGLAESFGLAAIIGAYAMGLALSRTELAKAVQHPITGLSHAIVPVFFVVMGMLVNLGAMRSVLVFGLVISALAIVGKIIGCGLPALAAGFNTRGATRIGFGMLPRGEVALIVAGVGLTRGAIGQDVFGVAIMMTLITTLLAPIVLVPLFRGGSGRRGHHEAAGASQT